jgi:transposase InsO family protein
MSLTSADGFVAGAPVGASSGAGPSLTSGAAYSTWAPLFLNYCTSIGLRDVLRKDIPKWKELCEAAEVWADETREALVDAALNGGPTASSSSSSAVKKEDVQAAAAAAAATQTTRAGVLRMLADSRRVYALLYRALGAELREQIPTDEGHAFALWRWLENKFQSKEADSVGALWSQWCEMRMEPDEVFDAYRARVNKLHTLLSSAKQRVESSFYTFILLDRLRPRYTQVVLALKAGAALKDPSAIDWDAVTTLVNAHERHEQNMNGTGEDERTMAAFSRQQKSKQTFSSSSSSSSPYDKQNFPAWMHGKDCFACDRKHHVTRVCPDTQKKAKWLEKKKAQEGRETAASAVQQRSRRQAEEQHEGDTEETGEEYAFSAVFISKKQTTFAAAKVVPPPRSKKQSIEDSLKSTAWGVDSMASCHLSGNKALFTGLRTVGATSVGTADGGAVLCTQMGNIHLRLQTADGKAISITIDNVWYNERVAANLLSTGMLRELGWEFHLTPAEQYLITPTEYKVRLSGRGRVSVLEQNTVERVYLAVAKVCTTADDLVALHERVGHMGFDKMIKVMKDGMTSGMGALNASAAALSEARQRCIDCTACVRAKGGRPSFGTDGLDKGSDVIEVLHMDSFEVRGASLSGKTEYGLTVNDPCSAARWFAHALSKDVLTERVTTIIIDAQTQTGKKVKRIHCDGGSEFNNSTLRKFCAANGTQLHISPARTPQMNGVAERSVRTLKEGGRTLLFHAGLPAHLWTYAVEHYVYVWNRLCTGPKTGVTPREAFRGVRPSIKHLGVFGCDVWRHLPREQRSTFEAKMQPAVYLGHSEMQNCPIVLLLETNKAVRTRDVRFPKKLSFKHATALNVGQAAVDHLVAAFSPLDESELAPVDEETQPDSAPTAQSPPSGVSNSGGSGGVSETSGPADDNGEFAIKRILNKKGTGRSLQYQVEWVGYPNAEDYSWEPAKNLKNAPDAVREFEEGSADTDNESEGGAVAHMVMSAIGREQNSGVEERTYDPEIVLAVAAAIKRLEAAAAPETYREATDSDDADQWRRAMDKEMKSCEDAGTWKRVRRADLPPNANVIPCKWVFKLKNDETGAVTEYKARLTPKGFKQKQGVDYFEVFARTGMYKTMRVGLALAALWDYELDQLDVPSAFLNAPIVEELYMEMPEGYREDGFVFKLEKALYGLKQAPRNWYLMVSMFLKAKEARSMGFTECVSDPCLFWRRTHTGRLILLFLFVDDFQVGYHREDREEWAGLKQLLIDRFRTKDMGESKWILGMRIQRDRVAGTLTLDQELYVSKALEKFGLAECKSMSTPALSAQEKESDEDGAGAPADKDRYMQIVGTLLYATISTRPDISFAVQKLTRHMQAPLKRHMAAAERTLRYLSGTKGLGLTFGRTHQQADDKQQLVVSAFADADWANDKIDRKSITGWVAKLCGDVISWASKKQRTVAQSTCEAELYAEAAAINEVLWLRGLLSELGLDVESPSLVLGDNQSTIAVSTNGVKSERTKHVDVKYHFITDEISKGAVDVKWVPSAEQQADIFTKALAAPVFELLRRQLMTR